MRHHRTETPDLFAIMTAPRPPRDVEELRAALNAPAVSEAIHALAVAGAERLREVRASLATTDDRATQDDAQARLAAELSTTAERVWDDWTWEIPEPFRRVPGDYTWTPEHSPSWAPPALTPRLAKRRARREAESMVQTIARIVADGADTLGKIVRESPAARDVTVRAVRAAIRAHRITRTGKRYAAR